MDKTGVYKLYKNENMVCYLDQLPPNWSVNVNFFCFCFVFLLRVNKCFLFSYIGSRSAWKPENRSVWISVLCRHKFHLLQINSSEIIRAAVDLCVWLKLKPTASSTCSGIVSTEVTHVSLLQSLQRGVLSPNFIFTLWFYWTMPQLLQTPHTWSPWQPHLELALHTVE